MATVIRNVGDIELREREALEHVLGQRLSDNHQLVIQIVDRQEKDSRNLESASSVVTNGAEFPEWCNVYAGLSDDEIAELEKTILTRADLSRSSE